ncbi:hypothetical protein P153DRAFT_289709 [Dothidotthia symphoricarpi CBS 119687]|uniref:Protein SQS1 n=1 Tax=Dothidotthia symphoricarpi CBS 119687 TaxID=1392245 RepID=A0A6A6AHT3_9PLEO|nr:uncharacterized protein P153DRAFT_289709 [Dothidotthia symphoricarpi CBS 119687]KAF2129991.1 hypothetical protein P153DRAFT_289709 [Dothidotthia symphoricarpi CBS 119687]
MSRGKKGKGKNKGSAKSTPHKTPSKRHSSQSWPAQEPMASKFSLKDEARWMSSHRTTAYESGRKLRDMPIQFVSAGHLEGTIKERLPVVESASSGSENESIAPSSPSSTRSPDNTRAMAQMAIRSPSPAASEASSSSADEVVFMGRDQTSLPHRAAATATQTPDNLATKVTPEASRGSTTHGTPQLTAASTEDHTSVNAEVETTASFDLSIPSNPTAIPENYDSDVDSIADQHFAKRRGGRPAWEGTTTEWEHRSKPGIGWQPAGSLLDADDVNPRDAAMDDYMQNMEDFGLTDDAIAASGFAPGFSRREMDLDAGSHNDWESASGSPDEADEFVAADSWDSDMLRDFADLSTSSDVIDTVVRIHSKRTRKTGVQYLCVYEGSVVDDARWLPVSFLKSKAEKELIRVYEEEADVRELAQNDSSDSEDEEEDDDDDIDDETLARVLQKQEELGLGSDELLLYAHDEFFGGGFDDAKGSSFASFGRPNKKRQARTRGNRDPTFPSASAMADALDMDPYGGFDIMDTERPSLRIKKKGRRGQRPPELDDSDLNEQLQMSWEADRNKKRLKKAEREELRQQGLLGRKGKGADLTVKYKGGLEMEDVVEEMREFMLGSMQTLSLPPMDAARRATIHQAASFLNLTSRSRGDGHDRFTILSKTSRTRVCTDDDFDRAIRSKGLLQRLLRSAPQKGARPAKSATFRQGGRARPQTGYRDGETVGANAPELGPENKGHALMMKMGWSKGMGLGAVDNKGILQPIPHTVKTNKAGLQ